MSICKNCGAAFEGKYCNSCGQKNYTEKDKSVWHLLEEALHFITHFEGTFFTTLKAVTLHPGRLATDFDQGRRKPYFKPVSFYLLLVVIYLVFPLAKGLNMALENYRTVPVTGKRMFPQVAHKAAQLGITVSELAVRFEEQAHLTSKILLFMFIPLSAALIFLLYPGRRRLWFDNLVLATEINIIYLLAFWLVAPLVLLRLASMAPSREDLIFSLFIGLFSLYVGLIFHNIFRSGWLISWLKGLLFSCLHFVLLLTIYKTLVFEVTMALLRR